MQTDSKQYILIAGLPRSGSTLLQTILNKPESTYTLPETHFFEEANKINPTYVFKSEQVIELLSLLHTKWSLSLNELSLQYQSFRDDRCHDIREVYFQVIEKYRPVSQTRTHVAIEKTPGNIIAIDSLITHNQTIKVILTGRNPLDFANSMVKQYWAPSSLVEVTKMWNSIMQKMADLKSQFPDRVSLIAYEDMITLPETTFKKIYDFVGLDWHSDFLQNLNANTAEFITAAETDWKKNNLELKHIHPSNVKLVLNHKQRMIVHRNNFSTAIRLRQLRYYRF